MKVCTNTVLSWASHLDPIDKFAEVSLARQCARRSIDYFSRLRQFVRTSDAGLTPLAFQLLAKAHQGFAESAEAARPSGSVARVWLGPLPSPGRRPRTMTSRPRMAHCSRRLVMPVIGLNPHAAPCASMAMLLQL